MRMGIGSKERKLHEGMIGCIWVMWIELHLILQRLDLAFSFAALQHLLEDFEIG